MISRLLFICNAFLKVSKVMSGNDLLTVREVAKKLRVDDTTVRRWVKQGLLDAVALPHAGPRCGYRFKEETLNEILNK